MSSDNSIEIEPVKYERYDVMQSQNLVGEFESLLRKKIVDFEFPTRVLNALRAENILTIGDLVKCNERQILMIPNLKKISLAHIKQILSKYSLCLSKDS